MGTAQDKPVGRLRQPGLAWAPAAAVVIQPVCG